VVIYPEIERMYPHDCGTKTILIHTPEPPAPKITEIVLTKHPNGAERSGKEIRRARRKITVGSFSKALFKPKK